ncbi:MAG: hypothetical protein WAN48_06895 [Actinomycetes bacterium]
MLVGVAFCPAPPLLVPVVASGAAFELDPVRAAALKAIDAVLDATPDLLVVVGKGPAGEFRAGSVGSLAGFGVDLEVTLGAAAGRPELASMPPSLTVGAWLLSQTESAVPVVAVSVADDLTPHAAAEVGEALGRRADRVALLVLGESSACLDARAPGAFDPTAPRAHAVLRDALATVDVVALLALDRAEAARLMVSGRVPWQVAAGGARQVSMVGDLLLDDAPYGVGYLVASWSTT